MGQTPRYLKTLEGIERECKPGLVNVLREEGLEAVCYFLWDLTGWYANHDPCMWSNRVTEERKMWVRMDRIACAVLREAHERQIGETMDALSAGPERFYESHLDRQWAGLLVLERLTKPAEGCLGWIAV